VIDVREFSGVGNGTTDDTGAIRAAIDFAKAQGKTVETVYFPGSPEPYLTREIVLGDADPEIVFKGDGPYATRIRIFGSDSGFGLSFGRTAGTSWGGLRDIRIESAVPVDAVVRVNAPHNGCVFERAMVNGAGQAKACYRIDAGSYFVAQCGYTTGATEWNFVLRGQSTVAIVALIGQNADVGGLGFVDMESQYAGPLVSVVAGRLEGMTGKDLVKVNCGAQGQIRFIGTHFSNGAAQSIVRKVAGVTPSWWVDGRFQNTPQNAYLDDTIPTATYPTTAADLGQPMTGVRTLRLGPNRLWVDAAGKLRVKSGEPANDTDGTIVGAQT
jgi:hypothetical protein